MTTKCQDADTQHSFTLSHLTTFSLRYFHYVHFKEHVSSVRPYPEVESSLLFVSSAIFL